MIEIEPIMPHLGAYIRIASEDVVKPGVPAQIMQALDRYNVLVFPQINLSDEGFLALTDALGDMHQSTVTDDGSAASDKGIFRIALDKDDRTQRDFIKGNDFWHMDGTSYDVPGKATLLKCEVPPAAGGDTEFANLFAAYDALAEDRKRELEDMQVVHCMSAVGMKLYADPTADDHARWNAVFPPRQRRMVWHQKDGRTSLIIGSTTSGIVGMDHESGAAFHGALLDWCTSDNFTYRHRWQAGDLVIFNNPGLLHRSHPYDENAGRVMHRTTLVGTEASF